MESEVIFLENKGEKSMIGYYIDLSFDEFVNEIQKSQFNTGVLNTLYVLLQNAYSNLVIRKDKLFEKKELLNINKEEYNNIIKGIYFNLFKIEKKLVYLKDLIQDNLNKVVSSEN